MENMIFRGRTYKFIGDESIICNCMDNGGRCNQFNDYSQSFPFIGSSDSEGYLCTRVWREVKEEPKVVEVAVVEENKTIDELIKECYELAGTIPFLEFYSHENLDCWKINNQFTHYAGDKLVLCTIHEGIEHALKLAIKNIAIRKKNFFEN